MNGLKIYGKKQQEDYGEAQKLSRIDYGFDDLIEPICEESKTYY